MADVFQYQVIMAENHHDLSRSGTALVRQGYLPTGGVAFDRTLCYQAFYKPVVDERNKESEDRK